MVSKTEEILEVGSCSNLGDAQARRLGIRVKGSDGNKYFAHTLNNTVVAPPRMLIAFSRTIFRQTVLSAFLKYFVHTWAVSLKSDRKRGKFCINI